MAIIYANSTSNIINGTNGDDIIIVDVDRALTINAGGGNDRIIILDGTGHTVNGGFGNDWIEYYSTATGPTLSVLSGDAGDDYFLLNGGPVVVAGGMGYDVTTSRGLSITWTGEATESWNLVGPALDFSESTLSHTVTATRIDNTIETGAGHDTLYGGGGQDTLRGNAGDDILFGGEGNDLVDGSLGTDTASYADLAVGVVVSLALAGAQNTVGGGVDTLVAVENLIGTDQNDRLTGNAGHNVLAGLNGNDTLTGGAGNDTASYEAAEARVFVDLNLTAAQNTNGAGTDQLLGIENLIGGAYDDRLTGNALANVLDGGMGIDTLTGGAGNDTYVVSTGLDALVEAAGGGTDWVLADASYTLAANLEHLRLRDFEDGRPREINGVGNALANQIIGSKGGNVISGGEGSDTLNGHDGRDNLTGGDGDDLINGGEGSDTASYLDALSGVTVVLSVRTAQNTGNSGLDTLIAIENLTGSRYADDLTGDDGANVLEGAEGGDTLSGGLGADILVGGGGIDRMTGGMGDDKYYVDAFGDLVIEGDLGGVDQVESTVSYTLTAYVENLLLAGAAPIEGRGNELGNRITGNNASNLLSGGLGNDGLSGASGNDTLSGGAGNDTYSGGMGEDTATFVDDQNGVVVDLVLGTARGTTTGEDRLDGIEGVVGTLGADTIMGGHFAEKLSGAGGNDSINAGSGNDILDGGAGVDTLIGGDGDDDYFIDNAGDLVQEFVAGGVDEVRVAISSYVLGQNVENAIYVGPGTLNFSGTGNDLANSLTGSTGHDSLAGGGGRDTLIGGSGNDRLTGGAEADMLDGGLGNDTFDFNALSDTGLGFAADQITGFVRGFDKIDLLDIDANAALAGNQAFAFVSGATAFTGAGQLIFSAGVLKGNVNADLAADFEIRVLGASALAGTDFVL